MVLRMSKASKIYKRSTKICRHVREGLLTGKGVARVWQGCGNGVERVWEVCGKGVGRVLEWFWNGVGSKQASTWRAFS